MKDLRDLKDLTIQDVNPCRTLLVTPEKMPVEPGTWNLESEKLVRAVAHVRVSKSGTRDMGPGRIQRT